MNPRHLPHWSNGVPLGCVASLILFLGGCSKPAPATPPAAAAPAVPVASAFPADASLRQAWNLIYGIRVDASGKRTETDPTAADFAQAEKIVQPAIAQKPTDPDTSVVFAHVSVGFISHGFDASDGRYKQAQAAAENALQVAPNNPEALVAMASYVVLKSPGAGGASQLLHQAIAINPNEPRYYRVLFMGALKGEQQMKTAEDTAARFPNDYLTQVDLARVYSDFGLAPMRDQALDRAIAISPDRALAHDLKAAGAKKP